ncbi:MAG: hypothetical protein ACRD4F_02570 [Candidatus Angelobacter sp.]
MAGDQYISEDQMHQYLRQTYAQDAEQNLLWQLARKMEDPVTPQNDEGGRRFHPLLLTIVGLIILVLATFTYFGLLRS